MWQGNYGGGYGGGGYGGGFNNERATDNFIQQNVPGGLNSKHTTISSSIRL